MFEKDMDKRQITMHQGDTGSYQIRAARKSGTAWTANDRMLYTIAGSGGIMMQRAYRLDREGKNGIADIEFHNADTQYWPAGTYSIEVRWFINAYWNIPNPPTTDVADLLDLYGPMANQGPLVDGDTVRTNRPETAWTLEIRDVIGEV